VAGKPVGIGVIISDAKGLVFAALSGAVKACVIAEAMGALQAT
jgi:hypothetical protein